VNSNSLRSTARGAFKERDERHQWRPYAEQLLNTYDLLVDIDGIIIGKDRMKMVPANHRFGVTLEYLKDLKLIMKKDEWSIADAAIALFLTALLPIRAADNTVPSWRKALLGTRDAYLGDDGGGVNTATVCDTADRYRDWLIPGTRRDVSHFSTV
jgi:hypothetical protein